ncbi:MAG: tail fiber protein [Chitinophagaceae bacterium]|jgi:microcystin-dependent protein|nr:tail fiber protein [Chitinophagaceae bacterium]
MPIDPFVGEINIFPFNFPPKGYATCAGQLLPISQNTALFSILGTTYGGNGQLNFGLPDLQGRMPVGAGRGPGLSDYTLGEDGGVETVTLLQSEMPSHTHTLTPGNAPGTVESPAVSPPASAGASWSTAGSQRPVPNLYQTSNPNVSMHPQALQIAGGSQPHNNMMPYITLNFCVALQGVFPERG